MNPIPMFKEKTTNQKLPRDPCRVVSSIQHPAPSVQKPATIELATVHFPSSTPKSMQRVLWRTSGLFNTVILLESQHEIAINEGLPLDTPGPSFCAATPPSPSYGKTGIPNAGISSNTALLTQSTDILYMISRQIFPLRSRLPRNDSFWNTWIVDERLVH